MFGKAKGSKERPRKEYIKVAEGTVADSKNKTNKRGGKGVGVGDIQSFGIGSSRKKHDALRMPYITGIQCIILPH